ncbi:MAG: acyl-CoA dehydrogenase [Acidimicrobiia bacterium]|nr:acyl-CoA dehydrogenase [Acidimicrobiia bacterium]
MTEYRAPLRDLRHALACFADLDGMSDFAEGVDVDTTMGFLEEAGRFMVEVLAPLNRVGDTQGSVRNDDGSVTTPDGWVEAYRQYVEAGWGAVSFDEAYGGGGFPHTVSLAIQEMMTSANMGFSLCPLLTQGAIEMLTHHGSEEQKETYLPKMVTGEWAGTMNLTEPDAGSDVGALRTRAVPVGDGTYRISGTKIFITYGDHDLSDNIIHLVLARTPDAPPGTKGISCFIVPKFVLDDDGSPGVRNDVACVSIEHKIGIHASPTCVMSFGENDGAVGYLIGEENQGMRYMFTMMNNARLSVGLSGLSLAERALQQSLTYAVERTQGRAIGAPAGASSPIIDHPDVRRMLMSMRSKVDAMRALLYLDAGAVDRADRHPEADVRVRNDELAQLLTPISKAWCTDLGVELTSTAIQIHGGMGYVEETGVAQYWRDSRITPIYEGTNGIQAMDLVMRKLPMDGGRVITRFLDDMSATVAELRRAGGPVDPLADPLEAAVAVLAETTGWLAENGMGDPAAALAGATPYLEMMGLVTGGWLSARSALAAHRALEAGTDDQDFYRAKIASASYFCTQELPRAHGLRAAVTAGAEALFALTPSQLGS